MRALGLLALAGCAASTDLGVIQRAPGEGLGASANAHLGVGAVVGPTVAVDTSVRIDVADGGSRFALGGNVLAGLPIGRFRALARAGVWRAVASTADERAAVPSFELAAYLPTHTMPDPRSKFGWSTYGVIVGVREDLDVAAYTTVFVGLQIFLIPGY